MPKRADNLNGSLELLILETLDFAPQHGFGIVAHIHTASENLLRVEEGSLYPALHRMEKQKLVAGTWQTTENGRKAKLYTITAARQSAPHRNQATLEIRRARRETGAALPEELN